MKFLLIFLMPLFSIKGYSQKNTLEVLKLEVSTLPEDSIFIAINNTLFELDSIHANNTDIIEILNYKIEIADSLNNRIMKLFALESLSKYSTEYTDKEYFDILFRLGEQQSRVSNTDDAMRSYFKAVELADSIRNDTLLAKVYRTIGIKYKNQENPNLALKYLRKGLFLYTEIKDSLGISKSYMTIGNAYKNLHLTDSTNLDTALIYYDKSLKMSALIGYVNGESGNYNNRGNVFRHQKKYEESLIEFFKAVDLNQKNENKEWLAFNYKNIGEAYNSMGKYRTAILYLEKSLKLKKELFRNELDISDTHSSLALNYSLLGEYKKAYEHIAESVRINKAVNIVERRRIAQELEAKFQNQKKEIEIKALKTEQSVQNLIISNQKKDLSYQEELRNKEQNLIYALGFILLSLIITIIVFWRNNKQRQKHNIELTQKNNEIEKANLKLDSARKNLELKNEEITDSINYAKRIQAAILPSEKTLASHLKDAFVIYLPKDIVAGDFYWTERIDDTILFAVADCTGHGVPGAMVSVICHNALNATIKQLKLTDPGEILDETTRLVLKQFEKSEEEVRDGMDIALCSFNVITRELKYAGANTPLLIVRNNEITGAEKSVIKYKATRQPVGNHTNRINFVSSIIPIQKGDLLYLSSDGYSDQFGGKKGKKFLNKRFRQLLIKIANTPLQNQKEILLENFINWKDSYEQVDDVCIMGIRIEK